MADDNEGVTAAPNTIYLFNFVDNNNKGASAPHATEPIGTLIIVGIFYWNKRW